jgi:hypothetical protein
MFCFVLLLEDQLCVCIVKWQPFVPRVNLNLQYLVMIMGLPMSLKNAYMQCLLSNLELCISKDNAYDDNNNVIRFVYQTPL